MTELDWSGFSELDPSVPGAVVWVRQAEEQSWRSFGAEWPGGPALDTRSVLYVSSIAKQFTAACIGLLAQDGTVRLDDDVREWISELPRYEFPVRLHHLLAHTSGLPDANRVDEAVGFDLEQRSTTADRVRMIATVDLEDEPGTRHRYNNLGYVLLAEVVERASGLPLGAFARERIFTPRSMSSTTFLDVARPSAVAGWRSGKGRVEIRTACVGDGGLVTNVEDLARWDRWLPQSDLAALMLGDRPRLPDGSWAHDAWGVSIRTHHGRRIESHGGSVQGHLASFVRFSDCGVSIIALANTDDIGEWGAKLRALADSTLGDALDLRSPPWSETHGIPVDAGPSYRAADHRAPGGSS